MYKGESDRSFEPLMKQRPKTNHDLFHRKMGLKSSVKVKEGQLNFAKAMKSHRLEAESS